MNSFYVKGGGGGGGDGEREPWKVKEVLSKIIIHLSLMLAM